MVLLRWCFCVFHAGVVCVVCVWCFFSPFFLCASDFARSLPRDLIQSLSKAISEGSRTIPLERALAEILPEEFLKHIYYILLESSF